MNYGRWLETLDWHEGPPPVPAQAEDPIYGSLRAAKTPTLRVAPGMVVRLRDGTTTLIGDVNENWGTCSCCSHDEPGYADVVAWARLFEAES